MTHVSTRVEGGPMEAEHVPCDALSIRAARIMSQFANGTDAGIDPQDVVDLLAALVAANTRMRAKLLELAGECAECGGTGLTTIRGMCGGVEMDCDDQPCPDCDDIREAAEAK